jgi:multidrug resistance efflux pump
MTSRLDQLKAKKAKLDAQIKQAESRARSQRRKDDTRRKILIGAVIKEHIEMHPDGKFAEAVHTLLDRYVTRPNDRQLLNMDTPADETSATVKPDFTMAG